VDENANPPLGDEDRFLEEWPIVAPVPSTTLSPTDPFRPCVLPHISVLPPSPTAPTALLRLSPTHGGPSNNNFAWADAELTRTTDAVALDNAHTKCFVSNHFIFLLKSSHLDDQNISRITERDDGDDT
jgi:hypothetical protein